MRLHGIHHVTCITGDAPQERRFYTDTLGLRMVKKTVNQDDPTVYHLFYADENGCGGRRHHLLRVPGRDPGRAGDGMVHRVVFRVGSDAALDFWQGGSAASATRRRRRLRRPRGPRLELVVDDCVDAPLVARHPEIPEEHALRGFAGVRAYAPDPELSPLPRGALGFTHGDGRRGGARRRAGRLDVYDAPPAGGACRAPERCTTSPGRRRRGARGVARPRDRGGREPTPVIDRF